MPDIIISAVGAHEVDAHVAALAGILADSVNDGAAVGFIEPFTAADGARFFREDVKPELAQGRRLLFLGWLDGTVAGTVQLILALPQNQPHRCEIAKMLVHPSARRRGLARRLLAVAETHAKNLGKTLITLDTRTGDVAEPLYLAAGFERAGVIPDYALDPDRKALHATTYLFKRLA